MSELLKSKNSDRFEKAIKRFDEENSGDPNLIEIDGKKRPRELVYAEWLTGWVLKLAPDAPEELRLAARCQHLCRWMVPRTSYPMTRAGYLSWREALKKFHAEKSAQILEETGYPASMIERVRSLNLKKGLPDDPLAQILEDALCMVFLERQLTDLADKTSEEKVVNALKKSWKKMSPAGRESAQSLPYAPREKALLKRALGISS